MRIKETNSLEVNHMQGKLSTSKPRWITIQTAAWARVSLTLMVGCLENLIDPITQPRLIRIQIEFGFLEAGIRDLSPEVALILVVVLMILGLAITDFSCLHTRVISWFCMVYIC